MSKFFSWSFAAVGTLLALGCGGGGASGGSGTPAPIGTPVAPDITSQPSSLGVANGGSAKFLVTANGNPVPTFAWQRSDDAGSTWNTIPGSNSDTFEATAQAADNLARFRAVATNTAGTATSRAVTLTVGSTIYMVGGWRTTTGSFPCYWLNGAFVNLPLPAGADGGAVIGLAVSGGHVYAGGSINVGVLNVPGYWLDRVWTALPLPPTGTSASVNDLAIDNGNIYMTAVAATPGYWLNGVWNDLSTQGGGNSSCGVSVSAGNVYVTGYSGYWLNGTWTALPAPSQSTASTLFPAKVVVSGSNVYVPGPCGYWLNGVWISLPLSSPQEPDLMAGLTVANSTVYATGYMNNGWDYSPGFWVNGVWSSLSPDPSSTGGSGNAMAVNGSTVYISGYSGGIEPLWWWSIPGYWVNGVWVGVDLPTNGIGGSAGAIIVQ